MSKKVILFLIVSLTIFLFSFYIYKNNIEKNKNNNFDYVDSDLYDNKNAKGLK